MIISPPDSPAVVPARAGTVLAYMGRLAILTAGLFCFAAGVVLTFHGLDGEIIAHHQKILLAIAVDVAHEDILHRGLLHHSRQRHQFKFKVPHILQDQALLLIGPHR